MRARDSDEPGWCSVTSCLTLLVLPTHLPSERTHESPPGVQPGELGLLRHRSEPTGRTEHAACCVNHRIRVLHGIGEEAASYFLALGIGEAVWNGQNWTGEKGPALGLIMNRQNSEALRLVCVNGLGPCVSQKRSPAPSNKSPTRRAAKNEDWKVLWGPRGDLDLPPTPFSSRLAGAGIPRGRGTG